MVFSCLLETDWSFAGIVSLQMGFGIWAGVCGLVIGFSLAFLQYLRIIEENNGE